MNTKGLVRRRWGFLACLVAVAASLAPARAGLYQTGQIVTNLTLINRLRWTNESGRVFASGTPLHLSDFSGKVLFMEFFDAT